MKSGKGTYRGKNFIYIGFFERDVIQGIGFFRDLDLGNEYYGFWEAGKQEQFGISKEFETPPHL